MLRITWLLVCAVVLTPQLATAQSRPAQETARTVAPPASRASATPASSQGVDGLGAALRFGYGFPTLMATGDDALGGFILGAVISQLDLNYAFTPKWVLAAYFGLGLGINPSYYRALCNEPKTDCATYVLTAGVGGEYRSARGQSVSPWVGLNVGMERTFRNVDGNKNQGDESYFGLAFGLSTGLDFPRKRWGVGPFLSFQVGRYTRGEIYEIDSSHHGHIHTTAPHVWVQLGVRARYQFFDNK